MSWILSFNKFILVPVITEWCKCDDILKLDSALCNHTDREYHQSLMSEYTGKYLGALLDGLTVDLSPILCDWIALRFPASSSADCVKSFSLKVQERSMSVYNNLDQTTRDRVMAFLQSVESLEILRCEKYRKLCESLFPLFHNIVKFSVTINCYLTTAVHATRLLESAAQNFSNLRVFHLSGCRHVSDIVLSAFIRQCKHLIELNVRGCSSLKGSFLLTMITTRSHIRMLNLLENWRSRYLLQYVLCAKGTESSHIGHNALIVRTLMWYSGSQLKCIMNLDGNTPQLMNEMLDCCPSLTKLEMTIINWDINIDVGQRLAIAWKQLTVLIMVLDLENFLILVNLVCTHCTVLQELNIMHRIHHRRLTVPGCQFNCHNLEKLTLRCSLSDDMLLGMLSQSRKFRKLDIVGCGTFPTVANISVVVPYLYNLEEFRIEHLSKASLNCILRYCSNLKMLCVPFNFKLPTDGSVFLPSLATLETRCNKLDGVWLVCPNLKELFASDITQVLAKLLVERLPRLRVLNCGVKDWRSMQSIQNSKLKIN